MAFETLLALAAEGDRQTLSEFAVKYPWLKEHVELGERVKPLRARLDALKFNDFEPAVKEVEEWRHWRNEDPKGWKHHEQQMAQLRDLVATSQAKISELEDGRGTEMSPDEVRTIVAETVKATLESAGMVDSKTLEAKLTALVSEQVQPKIEQYTNGLTSRFEDVFDKVERVIAAHRTDFNEYISPREVFEHMKKTSQTDPEKAYQDMVAPKLQEKRAKEQEDREKKAREEGVAQGRREAASTGGRANPTDSRGAVRSMGALQRRIHEKAAANSEKPGSDRLGSGVIAAKISAEHREKELAGTAA